MILKKTIIICATFLFLSNCITAQTWNALGSGFDGLTDVFYVSQNKLYAGGGFSNACGTPVYDVAVFDGQKWDSLSYGLGGEVYDFTLYNNNLIAVGEFQDINPNPPPTHNYSRFLDKWNDTIWQALSNAWIGVPSDRVSACAVYKGELYIGGSFSQIGFTSFGEIAKWNGTQWLNVGGGFIGQSTVQCMQVYNGELYVGGEFSLPSGPNNNFYNCVRWNGTKWDSVGGQFGPNYVTSFCVDSVKNLLYIGGGITYAGSVPIYSVAQWDGNNLSSPGGLGITNGAYTMSMFNNELYVGGSDLGCDTVLARYNGSNWNPVTPMPNQTVSALGVYNGNLYVGGYFDSIGTAKFNHIACYGKTCPLNVGVHELQAQGLKFKVYPNPAKEELNILVDETENKNYVLKIYSNTGDKVLERKISKQININTSGFSKGVYQVQVCDTNGKYCHSEKVVIQ